MTDQETALIGSLTKELWEDQNTLKNLTQKAVSRKDCLEKVIDALEEHKRCQLSKDGVLSFSKDNMMYRDACLYPEVNEICEMLNEINELKKKISKAEAELDRLRPHE